MIRWLLPLAALLFVAGCDPSITALTNAPPTAVAELDTMADTVRVSQGIALAVECTYQGSPCENAEAVSSDESIVRVFPAFVDLLSPADTYASISAKPRSAFVLVGGKPGDATVTIKTSSGDGDAELTVTTVALP